MGEPASEYDRETVRRNFVLNVMDGAVFAFGLSFASRSTVLPVYIHHIGGGAVALSIVPVVWTLGFNIPQIAAANHARQVSPMKPLLLRTALLQRLPWLLLAVAAVAVIPRVDPFVGLTVFFSLFLLAAVGGSVNLPVWFDIVSSVTPVRRRGRLFALRTVLGSLLGIVGGWGVERILAGGSGPVNFAVLFGAAFFVMMVSYAFLAFLKVDSPAVDRTEVRLAPYMRSLPELLRSRRNFRNFLVGEALLLTATVAEAFFAVDAIASFGLTDAASGRFTIVVMASMAAGALVFGYLADRLGHRLNLVLSAWCLFGGCLAALLASSVLVYYAAFVGSALAIGLRATSRFPLIAELCNEEDRPTYVALTNVLTAPFILLGVLGGWAAQHFGYDGVFAVAAALAFAAALWLMLAVAEPREELEDRLGY